MATATCTRCSKTDFMPDMECKACGTPYDDATQARIKLEAAKAAHATTDRPAQTSSRATRASKSEATKSTGGALLSIIVVLVAFRFLSDSDSEPSPVPAPACADNDARCLGIEAMDRSYAPCTRAIESQAMYAHRWTEGMLDQRFTQIDWYLPADRIIAYTGSTLEVQNGFGTWNRHSYFCAWNLSTGAVEKAGVND